MFECLGNLLENLKTFAKLFFDMPKSNQSHMLRFPETPYTYAACLCIELCQIVVTPVGVLFMLS